MLDDTYILCISQCEPLYSSLYQAYRFWDKNTLAVPPHSISNFLRWASSVESYDQRLSHGPTRDVQQWWCVCNVLRILRINVRIYPGISSSLSSARLVRGGTEYLLSLSSASFAYFVSWQTGVSLSPERTSDEFQAEFRAWGVRTDRPLNTLSRIHELAKWLENGLFPSR